MSDFKIPASALAQNGDGGLIQFEGKTARYTKEERVMMRSLTRPEMSFIHALKAEFDAELVTDED